MLTKTGFVSIAMLLFVSSEDSFVEGFFGIEQVKHDTRDPVRSRGDGLWSTQTAGHASEELSEIVVGVMKRMSTQTECERQAVADTSSLGEEDLSTCDLAFRTQAEPGCES